MAASEDLERKLDDLVRLMALLVVGERVGAEAISILGRARLDNELIAELVGTSPATVRATLSRQRRKTGKA